MQFFKARRKGNTFSVSSAQVSRDVMSSNLTTTKTWDLSSILDKNIVRMDICQIFIITDEKNIPPIAVSMLTV